MYLSCFFKVPNQPHQIEITTQIQTIPEFVQEHITLGDHLRRRRPEFSLYQKEVAIQIGVTTSTIWDWEHGPTIDKYIVPHVLDFLGLRPDGNSEAGKADYCLKS